MSTTGKWYAPFAAVCLGACFADMFHIFYGWQCVIMIGLFRAFERNLAKDKLLLTACFLALWALQVVFSQVDLWVLFRGSFLLALIPIFLSKDARPVFAKKPTRGIGPPKALQYCFYAFYPVQLIALFLIYGLGG